MCTKFILPALKRARRQYRDDIGPSRSSSGAPSDLLALSAAELFGSRLVLALPPMGPCPFLWRWLTILDLACGDIHDELRELRSIARAFEPSCGHIARRGSGALVIPSADRLGFHVCVCRSRLCLVAHAPTMPRLPGPFH